MAIIGERKLAKIICQLTNEVSAVGELEKEEIINIILGICGQEEDNLNRFITDRNCYWFVREIFKK